MSVFDVREDDVEEFDKIVFSEQRNKDTTVAYAIKPYKNYPGEVLIVDADYNHVGNTGYVVLVSKEDAENLIKALNKAVDLGWLK